MKLTKTPVFLHYFNKFMGILLFVLKYMFISLLLKMINGFSWSANIMASPFKSLSNSSCILNIKLWVHFGKYRKKSIIWASSLKPLCQHLTAHNWQKWKRVFLTYPCHEIYRDEAVGLKVRNILEKLWVLWKCEIWCNIVKNWCFVNNCLIEARI